MSPKEISDLLRSELKAIGMTQAEAARRSGLSINAVHSFMHGKHNATFYVATSVARAIGYEMTLVRNGALENRQIKPKVTMHNSPATYVRNKPENEYACLKCGRDAGVVTVAGHDQCARCGHIIRDCCND